MNSIRKILIKTVPFSGNVRFMKGFTLIELLVVIAIIGILSSIVLASLSNARNKGGDAQVQEQMSSLRSAAEIFFNSNAGYITTGTFTGGGSNDTTCSTGSPAGTGTFANTFLSDPTSGASNVIKAIAAPAAVTEIQCAVSTTGYVVVVNLPSNPATNPFWCVDSSGHAKAEPAINSFNGSTLVCN